MKGKEIMNRSQLKRNINGAITKYGKEQGNERAFLVNVIMGYIDLYYSKAEIRHNEELLKNEIKKESKENE